MSLIHPQNHTMTDRFDTSYFGIEWDSETFDKPWEDEDFLREIYQSDEEPFQQEIADELGCHLNTVNVYMPDDAQRGGEGLPYEDIAMFSGGYDSLVSTHYVMEELGGDVVLHIDTGTGIDENMEYVRFVCNWFGWDLEIIEPDVSLEEFAIQYGFPKAAAHSWIYRNLKQNPLSKFVTQIEHDKPSFYTGVRRNESERRMRNVTAERQESDDGRWWWESPISDFSDEDIVEYIVEYGLPRNPVCESIGRSGECFCGAYADRFSELLTLEEDYPDHYRWILDIESRVQGEIGIDEDYCYWGSSGMSSDDLEELMEAEDNEPDMEMCVDCEGGAHRDFGHDVEPTYEKIYVAATVQEHEDFYQFVSSYDETVEWIDPFELNDFVNEEVAYRNSDGVFGKNIDELRRSDAILAQWDGDMTEAGMPMEIVLATNMIGIPAVVHNNTDNLVPTMLKGAATEIYTDKKEAVQAACRLSRQKLVEIDGEEKIFVK